MNHIAKQIADCEYKYLLKSQERNLARYMRNPKTYIRNLFIYVSIFDRGHLRMIKEKGCNDVRLNTLHGHELKEYIKDILLWSYAYGYLPEEYFIFDFADKSAEERLTYLSVLAMGKAWFPTISAEAKEKFVDQDKWRIYRTFKPMFRRDIIHLPTDHSQDAAFLDFVGKHHDFIVKPLDDYGGHGIHKVHLEPGHEQEMLNQLHKEAPLLIEELITQSEKMASLNVSSVNTLRVVTFQGGGEFEIAFAMQRVGRVSSEVDNVTSGGMAILVDLDTHRTLNAMEDNHGIRTDTKHPDSGIELSNFEVPDWDGMVALLKQGVSLMPKGMHYCGWDFCHTDHGWDTVEVNDTAFYGDWSILTGKGKADYFRKTIAKYAELENQARKQELR